MKNEKCGNKTLRVCGNGGVRKNNGKWQAVVTVADNPATEPRSGSVVISADVAGVGPKAVKVVQEGRSFHSIARS